jgi:hypothetical protein
MVGVFLMFRREREREKSVKKSSSSPASHVQGKKKTHSVVQNGTVWVLFFFESVHETTPFLGKTRRFI